MKFIDLILMLGGFAAAAAIAVVCLLGMVVWMAGGRSGTRK